MMQGLFSHPTRLLAAAAAALGVFALSATSAHAAIISTDACDNSALTQPFAPWGDTSLYKLVPGGSFEGDAAGWTLSRGARVVAGGAPDAAAGLTGSSSVNLPAGGSVQSPFTCVDAAYPTFRFFARNNGLLSTVLVSVVYRLPLLGPVAVPVGTVVLNGQWAPSLPMLTASVVTGALSQGTTQVALRFTALTGDTQIDDVFVDPRMH
ncbi:MAG TPA: hypothetical protein VG325_00110 [Solirubrobacteraceae bacterium]|jgi:hypothetical protein|nr:hypothetical protein [Solirubrobacteraceae bacterium]